MGEQLSVPGTIQGRGGGMVGGASRMRTLYPIFVEQLQPFFVGKDARDLDLILDRVHVYNFNLPYQGIALGIPLATIEFAVLDLLGHRGAFDRAIVWGDPSSGGGGVSGDGMARGVVGGNLRSHQEGGGGARGAGPQDQGRGPDVHDQGTARQGAHRQNRAADPDVEGNISVRTWRSTRMPNGDYDVEGAIRVGRLLEQNKYAYFEEPVMFDDFEAIKKVADASAI